MGEQPEKATPTTTTIGQKGIFGAAPAVATAVVPVSPVGAKRVGSSGDPVSTSEASFQSSTASTRPRLGLGGPSASGQSLPDILQDGRVPNFKAALKWAMKGTPII